MSRLMRTIWTLPFLAAAALAAPAPPADEKAEADAHLDAVLREWAKASDAVREAHFTIGVTETDPVLDTTTSSGVEVFVRKPDLMRVDFKDAKGDFQRSFVCRGRTIHEWDAPRKEERIYSLSPEFGFPEKPERYPDDFLNSIRGKVLECLSWLAVGPPVRDLKLRFDLRLTKENNNWTYLEIKPRKQDRREFRRIQVVLESKTFRIHRLWIEQPNGAETTYNFDPPGGSEESVTPESIGKGLPEDYRKVDIDGPFDEMRTGRDESGGKP